MKVEKEDIKLEMSNNLSEVGFQTSETGLTYLIEIVAKSQYQNPLRSLMTEYVQNGLDAHTVAGKQHIPVEVYLPTTFEPTYRVRDYGTGLTREEVESLYTAIGESTKAHRNDLLGGFGLGKLVFAAYSGVMNLISFKDGIKSAYFCRLQNGEGGIAHVFTEATSEEDGLMIEVPIKKEDIGKTLEVAGSLYRYLPDRIKVYEGDKAADSEVKLSDYREGGVTETEDYILSKTEDHCCLIGGLPFPLDLGLCGLGTEYRGIRCILKFAIGSVDITSSRDNLRYTDKTKAEVVRVITKLAQQLSNDLGCELAAAEVCGLPDFLCKLSQLVSRHPSCFIYLPTILGRHFPNIPAVLEKTLHALLRDNKIALDRRTNPVQNLVIKLPSKEAYGHSCEVRIFDILEYSGIQLGDGLDAKIYNITTNSRAKKKNKYKCCTSQKDIAACLHEIANTRTPASYSGVFVDVLPYKLEDNLKLVNYLEDRLDRTPMSRAFCGYRYCLVARDEKVIETLKALLVWGSTTPTSIECYKKELDDKLELEKQARQLETKAKRAAAIAERKLNTNAPIKRILDKRSTCQVLLKNNTLFSSKGASEFQECWTSETTTTVEELKPGLVFKISSFELEDFQPREYIISRKSFYDLVIRLAKTILGNEYQIYGVRRNIEKFENREHTKLASTFFTDTLRDWALDPAKCILLTYIKQHDAIPFVLLLDNADKEKLSDMFVYNYTIAGQRDRASVYMAILKTKVKSEKIKALLEPVINFRKIYHEYGSAINDLLLAGTCLRDIIVAERDTEPTHPGLKLEKIYSDIVINCRESEDYKKFERMMLSVCSGKPLFEVFPLLDPDSKYKELTDEKVEYVLSLLKTKLF